MKPIRSARRSARSPLNRSLDQLCSDALARAGTQPSIEFEKHWIHWHEVRRVAERVRALVASSGAGEYAQVGFVARNTPSALAALLGLLAQRCSIRMIYPFQSAEALASDIARIAPDVVVADKADYCAAIATALQTCGAVGISLSRMDASVVPGSAFARQTGVSRIEPRIEILTSGTTGPPKAFALSYPFVAKHIAGATMQSAAPGVDPQALPPTLLMFPVSNISGLYSTLPALLSGQRIVLLERFTVAGWHDYVLRFQPQVSGLPPAGVQMILEAGIPPADLACLRGLGTGAAPLDPRVHREFEERYGVPILLSYGATEFGGPVTRMTPALHQVWGAKKFGSVGCALPGVQLRIIDAKTGATLAPGCEGTLEVVAPHISPDWIRTSDLAVLDADGFLFHRGRTDGAIVRGGFKLLPLAIEHPLLLHPAISATVVVGIPDQRLGQVPVAAIEFRAGVAQPSMTELESHLRKHLPATHIPVAWRFVDALPRTPSMKVDLTAVRRLFEGHVTS